MALMPIHPNLDRTRNRHSTGRSHLCRPHLAGLVFIIALATGCGPSIPFVKPSDLQVASRNETLHLTNAYRFDRPRLSPRSRLEQLSIQSGAYTSIGSDSHGTFYSGPDHCLHKHWPHNGNGIRTHCVLYKPHNAQAPWKLYQEVGDELDADGEPLPPASEFFGPMYGAVGVLIADMSDSRKQGRLYEVCDLPEALRDAIVLNNIGDLPAASALPNYDQ